ncbi:MAG: NTP transferase domain-containing protein, partial [Thermodesulfovibrionales bacterium]|nr:NTP transferase domain-containing protein [Thermodesulfovibrionales bacterium]
MSIYGNILTGVLLAGGQNKRFPYLKGFIKVNGLTILEKNLGILKDLFQEVFLSANEPLPYLQFKAPIVKDLLPSTGPITG